MNQYTLLLTIGGMYLVYRQRAAEALYSALVGINTALETYDALNPDNGECTKNILCTRENTRHKRGCMGRTERHDVFVRGLERA